MTCGCVCACVHCLTCAVRQKVINLTIDSKQWHTLAHNHPQTVMYSNLHASLHSDKTWQQELPTDSCRYFMQILFKKKKTSLCWISLLLLFWLLHAQHALLSPWRYICLCEHLLHIVCVFCWYSHVCLFLMVLCAFHACKSKELVNFE